MLPRSRPTKLMGKRKNSLSIEKVQPMLRAREEGDTRIYRKIGQPVIVGGSMETGSYLLVGTEKAMKETFGSTMHGSGRTMSRTAAKKKVIGAELKKEMERAGS